MKALLSCIPNLEDVAIKEVYNLIKIKAKKTKIPGKLILSTNLKKLCALAYSTRVLLGVGILLKEFNFNQKSEIISKLEKINFKSFLKNSFMVECKRTGNHNFSSQDISKEANIFIQKKYKVNIDFKNPETIIKVEIINNICFVCIDLAGFPLNKRFYKVKTHFLDINSCLAASLLKIANYSSKKTLLDPFCNCSTILIEAALVATNTSPAYFKKDEFKFNHLVKFNFNELDKKIHPNIKTNIIGFDKFYYNIRNSIINAKVAKIDTKVQFFNFDIIWLETKLKKELIDLIITRPPISKKIDLEKIYKDLFTQAFYVLKKNGLLLILTNKFELILKNALKFKIIKKRKILIGNELNEILIFKKCAQKKI